MCVFCDEKWELYHEVRRRAAKKHACAECKGVIQIGEEHIYFAGRIWAEWSEGRICLQCVNDYQTFGSLVSEDQVDQFAHAGGLAVLIEEAREHNLIPIDHPLVVRWQEIATAQQASP